MKKKIYENLSFNFMVLLDVIFFNVDLCEYINVSVSWIIIKVVLYFMVRDDDFLILCECNVNFFDYNLKVCWLCLGIVRFSMFWV